MRTKRIEPGRLQTFFHPTSIALVGATDKSRWSLFTFTNLKHLNFRGPVYCVNPNQTVAHGQKTYKSLLEIADPVDLAFIMVPTNRVIDVMKDAATKKIRNLVILTAGFSETGEEGSQLEKEIHNFAKQNDQLILGPNGNGFINVSGSIVPYGLPVETPVQTGPVGVVLQSGALASSIITLSKARKIDLSFLISMGNESMISATDMIDYLIEDEATRVIALFLESIREPDEFRRVAQKAIKHGKPIVTFKIGRSEESARSAMAHTGSLVGDDAVNDAVFRQLGIIRVDSLEDLLTTAGLLGYFPTLKGPRLGIVTPSGGACDILADRAMDEQLELPTFHRSTINKLEQIVPVFSTIHNPLDVTGYVVVDRTLLARSLKAVSEDPDLDIVLCITEPPRAEPPNPELVREQFESLSVIMKNSNIPIIPMMNAAIDISPFGKQLIEEYGVHFVGGMEHGMTAIGNAVWWYERYQELKDAREQRLDDPIKPSATDHVEKSGEWSEHESREFLLQYGVPVVPGIMTTDEHEAAAAAEKVGFPSVLKIQSRDIAHKSDIGGVAVGLKTADEVKHAYSVMMDNVKKHASGSKVDGVLVSPLRSGGTELLVGIVKDPLWGQVLAVGFGGIYVEVLKDTSLRVLPVTRSEIKTMFQELRGSALLEGVRGEKAADLDRLADVIFKVTQIATGHANELEELEMNPLWVKGDKVEALDALMKWRRHTPMISS